MNVDLTAVGSRFAVIGIEDGGNYETAGNYCIYINEKLFTEKAKSVNYVGSLRPDTEYSVRIEGDESTSLNFRTSAEYVTLDVRKFGAKGDGIHDDTIFIQAAVMACPEGGRVFIPEGTYKITSLFLKSHISIEIGEGAVLSADTERYSYPILPGMIKSYDEKGEYNLGTWEGNPLQMFSSVITGIDVCDVTIYGKGSINGNASYENWWHDEKVMKGAFRPRLLFLERCRDISVYGIHLENSPSWTVHPYFSRSIRLCAVSINNPRVSPNTDGIDVESCCGVEILGVRFTLGDDCIALKSGKIYMGRKYRTPCENVTIKNCLMENGHGAVTVGSELSAGIKDIKVVNCDFSDTDRGLRIKTRRGRGKDAVIENVLFENIFMKGVKVPFAANAFYFCDPDGRTDNVQNRAYHTPDETTPYIGALSFRHIKCVDCHAAAAFFIGLPESMIGRIEMQDVDISYASSPESFMPEMLCGVEEMQGRGVIAENVKELILEDVTLRGIKEKPVECTNVDAVKGEVSCR
ncbi:MAG: glycoside hydrolase family 28 protein [Oscillospiraceae bacterium]|nr:glycoside hydrolase family 28 protein [Oscillospiraceae bacterium]